MTNIKFKIIILFLFLSLFWRCQNLDKEVKQSCNYYGLSTMNIDGEINFKGYQFNSNDEAIKAVDRILSEVGLHRNFEIFPHNEIDNAAAIVQGKNRYILYNKNFINLVDKITGSQWAAISILAHEIGHHLQRHTLSDVGSRPQFELEADKFSGFIMAKLGASLEDAQKAIATLVSKEGSKTHPPRNQRLVAIAQGYAEGINKKVETNAVVQENNQVPQAQPNDINKESSKNLEKIKAEKIEEGEIIDKKDNQMYKSKNINGKLWLVEDCNFNIAGSVKGKKCRYYTFDQAQEACPSGFRLPSIDDWIELLHYLYPSVEAALNHVNINQIDRLNVLELSNSKSNDGNYEFWSSTYKWHFFIDTKPDYNNNLYIGYDNTYSAKNKFKCRCISN